MDTGPGPKQGMRRGRVFPAVHARSLVNPLRRLVQPPRRTVGAMVLTPGQKVLELGCGPGFFSPFLAEAVSHGSVVLVDLQFPMLLHARKRLVARSNVLYLVGEASALPLRAACFDAVLLATVLGEVRKRDSCLEEIRRVLAPGGIVTVVETRRDADFIAFPKLRRLFYHHGFAFMDRQGGTWQYAARFRAI